MQMFSERFCMIDMNQVIRRIQEAPFHIYDLAMYDHGTVSFHRFEPCSVSNNSYSVAKVFLMTAIGFLYDAHTISMSDRVCDILGDLVPQNINPAWKLVTIDHVLTHRIGFREGFLDIGLEDASAYPTQDYLSMVFSRPLAYNPGEKYDYSDAAFYLLSRIVSQLTGIPADRFLMDRLFAPMRFREVAWSHCPLGFPIGATGLYISTPDMLKIALLYMHDGVYENQRYLSSQWVRTALAREYELHPFSPDGFTGKHGMYGQAVVFSSADQVAFAVHAHEEKNQRLIIPLLESLVRKSR